MIRVANAWGIASLRQSAGFAAKFPKKIDCPIGSCIARWNFTTKTREVFFQSSSDLISVLLPSPTDDIVLAVSYIGELKLYNRDYKVVMPEINIPTTNIVYGSWSMEGTRFAVCSKGSSAMVIVYSLTKAHDGAVKVLEEWRAIAPQEQLISCDHLPRRPDAQSNNLTQAANTNVKLYDCYDMGVFTEDNQFFLAVLQITEGNSEVHQFSWSGQLVDKKVVSAFDDEVAVVLCVSQCHDNLIALGLRRGLFILMDTHTLDNVAVIQAPGAPQVCLWDGDSLMTVGYTSKEVTWWNRQGVMTSECQTGPGDSVIFMAWEEEGISLWIGGIMSLHYTQIFQTESGPELMVMFSMKYDDVSGCGIAMDDKQLVVSGDLTGNVFQWSKASDCFNHKCNSGSSVRTITASNLGYFIGDLDGDLRCWKMDNLDKPPVMMWSFGDSVMNMRISKDNTRILVGTGGGKVFMFDIKYVDKKISFVKVLEILTHEPKMCHDAKHGWENRSMEVWSVCWSPDETMFASASEDHTTNVWLIKTGKKMATLTGHTTAVTSVDWKELSNGSVLFATCADDQTIRLSDGHSFQLQKILQVDGIYGWFTLTYMAINPITDRIFCSTQNGYVVIWDCKACKWVAKRRMHSGSIEGLVLSKDFSQFATIGSDCVASRFFIKEGN